MSTPPAGWYADPAGSEQFRWWDGQRWTEALSPVAQARPPVGANPVPEDVAAHDEAADAIGAVDTLTIGPTHRRSLAPVALLVVLALIAVGVGAAVLRPAADTSGSSNSAPSTSGAPGTSSAPSASAADPSELQRPAGSVPPGWLNVASGEARIGDAVMTLPGSPYTISDQPVRPAEMFDAGFAANALVHDSRSDVPGWYSTVALLHVPADEVGDSDTATARRAAPAVLNYLFSDVAIKPKGIVIADDIVSGRPATRVTGEIWYAVAGLASSHDDVTLRIVRLADGSYIAAVSSVPNDAADQQRELAAAALNTLSVR